MPDKAGAFLRASRVIAEHGGNIVRVDYNKAVDLHTLFIEVSADEEQHKRILSELESKGYITGTEESRDYSGRSEAGAAARESRCTGIRYRKEEY